MECPFCNFRGDSLGKVVLENEYCVFIQDYNSIPEGSGIIISKEHRETAFDLTYLEWESTYSLLHKAKDFAIETGAKSISLSTAPDNYSAQRLYEKNGYIQDSQFYHYELSLT